MLSIFIETHIILVFPWYFTLFDPQQIISLVFPCLWGGPRAVLLPRWKGIKTSWSVVESSWSVFVSQAVSVEAAWVYMWATSIYMLYTCVHRNAYYTSIHWYFALFDPQHIISLLVPCLWGAAGRLGVSLNRLWVSLCRKLWALRRPGYICEQHRSVCYIHVCIEMHIILVFTDILLYLILNTL
jgi:hypothetical protein